MILSNYIFPKPQKAVCQSVAMRLMHALSFEARRLKLCMWPLHIWALVLGHMRPASTASEAVTSHVLFGVSKKHRRKHFSRSRQDFKVVR